MPFDESIQHFTDYHSGKQKMIAPKDTVEEIFTAFKSLPKAKKREFFSSKSCEEAMEISPLAKFMSLPGWD